MEAKFGDFFTNFKQVINELVGLVKTFTDTITKFVDGFKKTINVGEFTDHEEG